SCQLYPICPPPIKPRSFVSKLAVTACAVAAPNPGNAPAPGQPPMLGLQKEDVMELLIPLLFPHPPPAFRPTYHPAERFQHADREERRGEIDGEIPRGEEHDEAAKIAIPERTGQQLE